VAELKGQLAVQEERRQKALAVQQLELAVQEERRQKELAVQQKELAVLEEQLRRVQIETLAESRKQILDFITTSGYKGLRDMVEYQSEERK
jgi:flagellar motility protein MotE (MotC chaperone)